MLAHGNTVGGYLIEEELGTGGMGAVYSARHRWLGRRAAVKILHDDLDAVPALRDRLLQEARITSDLDHPNIVEVIDAGVHEGRPYLAMELLEGENLGDRLARGRLSPFEVIDLLRQICSALAAAHGSGVIHRDLKPDNIFLVQQGRHTVAKVLDWGVARSSKIARGITSEGALVGTPEYMAPEQASGGEVGAATDVYSLGAMAWQMFLESVPFDAETAIEILSQHITQKPEPPSSLWPDIPPALEKLLLRMLAKRPADRPSVGEILDVLDEVEEELRGRRSVVMLTVRKRSGWHWPVLVVAAEIAFGMWSLFGT
jgi:eukaryotic-like serine/threonine-protein kinase